MARRRKRRTTRKQPYRTYKRAPKKWFDDWNFDLELEPAVVREIIAIALIGGGIFTL